MNVSERLLEIARIRVPTRWSYQGPLTLVVGDERIEGLASSELRLRGGAVKSRLDVRRTRRLNTDHPYEGHIELPCEGSAVATHAFAYLRRLSDIARYHLRFHDLTVGSFPPDAAFARETMLGMTLGLIDGKFDAGITTTVFGREAIVKGYRARKDAANDSIQVVYQGAPFGFQNEERPALHDLLRFLTGRRGASWFVETFDSECRRLGFYFRNNGGIVEWRSFLQPINLNYASDELPVLAACFPNMLDRLFGFRAANRNRLDATIHHYNDGASQSYPTSRMRDLSVALEALVGALRATPPHNVLWVEPDFDKRIKPVLRAFDISFHDVPEPALSALRNKIMALNNASPREDMFRFLERLGINPTPKERSTILGYRNGILHGGHRGDEARVEGLRRNAEASDAFANVFHRAFLKALGYTGRYRPANADESLPLEQAPPYPLLE